MRFDRRIRKCFTRSQRFHEAFTLVEVMVAVLIVGFMFTTIYAGITQSFTITRVTRENLRAIQMLQDKTETIRLYTWDQINTLNFIPATFTNWFIPAIFSTNGGVMFTGTITVTNSPLTESYASDVKLVTVTISWKSGNNTFQHQMLTLISHYGLQNYIYSD